ncbi:MAG TPA: CstA-like transporter-associated (seleno)protein [Methylomirabilota bacterium]|nr:CstA-like transporter-associated (seleno)protein [Methylomirabilota bacterium]
MLFLLRAFRIFWRALREWSGDAAYERYLCALQGGRGETPAPLSPTDFYLEQLERRYATPSRCC